MARQLYMEIWEEVHQARAIPIVMAGVVVELEQLVHQIPAIMVGQVEQELT